MNNILFPTDFSENSKNAFAYALKFARKVDAKIHLFHAYHIPYIHAEMPAGMYQTAIEEAEKEARAELEKMCEEVNNTLDGPGAACQLEVQLGFAVEEILKASEKGIDLIIMGTQGESGMAEVIFGGITSKIISKAECPVLAVPENCTYEDISNIVFATSYEESDLNALNKLVKFARDLNANIQILHINDRSETINKSEEESFKDKIRSRLEFKDLHFQVSTGDDVSSGINKYVSENNIHLIALMKKKRNLIESIFHESTTKKMTFHSKIPVLAYHE